MTTPRGKDPQSAPV